MNDRVSPWGAAGAGCFVIIAGGAVVITLTKLIRQHFGPDAVVYMWTLAIVCLGVLIILKNRASKAKPNQILGVLRRFAWFCSKENRIHIALIIGDLKKDARGMRSQGRGRFFVATVLLWHSFFGVVIPIFCDGLWRVLKPLLPLGRLVTGIKFLFR